MREESIISSTHMHDYVLTTSAHAYGHNAFQVTLTHQWSRNTTHHRTHCGVAQGS